MTEFEKYASLGRGISSNTLSRLLMDRNYWMSASEALEYGMIDKILTRDGKKS